MTDAGSTESAEASASRPAPARAEERIELRAAGRAVQREILRGQGNLVIIGGGEDREHDMDILAHFVDLAGGEEARIAVITSASRIPDDMWALYDGAFAELGVRERYDTRITTREQANDPATAAQLERASGIFMTGGDQKRLLALLGGTLADAAIHRAWHERGATIGGTSAGASAMSGHMLADAQAGDQPTKGSVTLAVGLGLAQRVVIDQHFSQRKRLGRLLTVVAQNPFVQGIGIDEDTALVVARGAGIEVIGSGAVTIIDGRQLYTNIADIGRDEAPELIDVRLHLLPSQSRFRIGPDAGAEAPPEPVREVIETLARLA